MSEVGKVVHVGGSATAMGSALVAVVTAPDASTSDKAVLLGVGSILAALSPTLLAAVNQVGTAANAAITGWFADRRDERAERRAERERNFQSQLDAARAEISAAQRRASEAEAKITALQAGLAANSARSGAIEGKTDALADKLAEQGFLPLPPRLTATPGTNWPWVLIAEDNPKSANQYSRLLLGYGYRTAHVPTAAEAIERVRADHPAYVILDLLLADGDGLPVLQVIREEGIPSRVIVATGAVDPERLAAVRALHPDALLHKPLDVDELLSVIETGSSGEIETIKPTG